MKKTIIIFIIIILLAILIPIIYFQIQIKDATDNINIYNDNLDSKTFKYEYENLNTVLKDDGTNKYVNINISENNKMKYVSYQELTSILKNGTGVIYLGFPECPWCRRVLPVLLSACDDYDFQNIYYYNALDIRDKKHLDENGIIITDKEGDIKYYELVDILKDFLGEYSGLNDSTIKRIYFPTIFFVKDGKILGTQISAVDSYTSTKEDMNDTQKQELKSIFNNYLNKMYKKSEKATCSDKNTEGC